MGYRYDFEKMKVVETGGIYVRTFPAADEIIVDSKITTKPGLFSNNAFIQSLLPKKHTVLIKKADYYDYTKNLTVQERTVTKLENVTLFKKSLEFTPIIEFPILGNEKLFDIIWSKNSQASLVKTQASNQIFYYYFDLELFIKSQDISLAFYRLPYLDKNSKQISFNPKNLQEIFYVENNTLYSLKNKKPSTIVKGLISYEFLNDNIIWLSTAGKLKQSDSTGVLIKNLTMKSPTLSPSQNYKIITDSENIFLQTNNSLLLFNTETKIFENFQNLAESYTPATSPDNKNIILYNNSEIFVYSYLEKTFEKLYLGNKITNLQWLNNDYIIFSSDNKVIISEIDYRGNINTVTLASTQSPILNYDFQSGKAYILNNNELIISEKITP